MANPTNHTGKKFNRLTATKKVGLYYRCSCECGGTALVRSDHLYSGHTKSCGCIQRELVQQREARVAIKQAERAAAKAARDPHLAALRNVWQNMIYRCTSTTCPEYVRYGAVGITVCDSWAASFDAFYADMRPKYKPGKSIDRRDNDGGYSPQNCRWATPTMQTRNRKNTLYVCSGAGVRDTTLAAFAEKHKISYHRAYGVYKQLAVGADIPTAWDMRALLGLEAPKEKVTHRTVNFSTSPAEVRHVQNQSVERTLTGC